MKHLISSICLASALFVTPVSAQFTGPGVSGAPSTVAEAAAARPGTYVTLTGNIVAHQRADFYTFRDESGEIRVEVSSDTFRGTPVAPDTRVRLLGEVDTGRNGTYVWVKALDIAP
jgi:uncharacterized protein (TIGR00156 family)